MSEASHDLNRLLDQPVAACAKAPQDNVQTPVATPSTSSEHSYRCESGETIAATYPSSDAATVHYKARTYNMDIAVSASGARYVGDDLEWWTKGSGRGAEGTLFHHMADGTSDEIIDHCNEI